MIPDSSADSILKSLGGEVVKTKSFIDGSDRVTERYEALANTGHGGPCLKTEYTYHGTTSVVDKSKESQATWDSAWEI